MAALTSWIQLTSVQCLRMSAQHMGRRKEKKKKEQTSGSLPSFPCPSLVDSSRAPPPALDLRLLDDDFRAVGKGQDVPATTATKKKKEEKKKGQPKGASRRGGREEEGKTKLLSPYSDVRGALFVSSSSASVKWNPNTGLLLLASSRLTLSSISHVRVAVVILTKKELSPSRNSSFLKFALLIIHSLFFTLSISSLSLSSLSFHFTSIVAVPSRHCSFFFSNAGVNLRPSN